MHAAGKLESPGVIRVCCVGNKLIQAPDYTQNVSLDWRLAQLASGDLRLLVDANYYGKQYFDAFNTERDAQSAYGIVNARFASASTAKRGFGADLWIKHLTNRQYLSYALNQNDWTPGCSDLTMAWWENPDLRR